MAYPFPPELGRKVRERMATGEYRSEDDLLLDAMLALEDVTKREQELRSELGRRIRKTGTSLSKPLDRSAFKADVRGIAGKED